MKPALSTHKERYELLIERRRLMLELARLRTQIDTHPRWQQVLLTHPDLQLDCDHVLESLGCKLCQKVCQAECPVILGDVRRIYNRLIVLAKVWVALEADQPISVLYDALACLEESAE
ncbi:MAG: hypothetical protein AAF708_12060 [Deinococcota bacterium]